MKRLQLGLTEQEREQNDRARRARNIMVAAGVLFLVDCLILFLLGEPR